MNSFKRIISLLLVALSTLILVGCRKEPQYTVTNALFDFRHFDSEESLSKPYSFPGIRTGEEGSEYEYVYRYGSYLNGCPNVPLKRTVVIDGIKVEGEYIRSRQEMAETSMRHTYSCGNEVDRIKEFTCDDKGRVLAFKYNYKDDKNALQELSAKEMEAISRDYLKQYIDIDSFIVEKIENSEKHMFQTHISFTRLINGIKAHESVGVNLDNSSGKVISFSSYNLGMGRYSFTAPAFDVEKAENAVLSLMEKYYNKPDKSFVLEYYISQETKYWKSPILGWGLLIHAQSRASKEWIGCVGGYYFVQ